MGSQYRNNRSRNRAEAFARKHPRKSLAAMVAAVLGMGCSAFPLGSTVRLVCGAAEGVVKIIEAQNASAAPRDASTELDASR